jgi:hypothetical protein
MMDLFDIFIEKTIISSKAIRGLTDKVIEIADEVRSIKESIATIAKAIKLHQVMIDELLSDQINDGFDVLPVDIKNEKKEKPN